MWQKSRSSEVALRKAWRAVVPRSLLKYGQPAAVALALRRVKTSLANGEPAHSRGPLIVSGLTASTKGISRAARLTIVGLHTAGHSPIAHDLAEVFTSTGEQINRLPISRPGGVWLIHMNAPEAIVAMARIRPADWLGRYRIGYWAYELSRVPKRWVMVSEVFHEIWVPSRFVADALIASGVTRPVRVMPHPVALSPPLVTAPTRSEDFIVLAMGDLRSSAARKNLIGAINIYKRAFPQQSSAMRLILKVQSDDAHPQFRGAAKSEAAGRGDVAFLAGSLSDQEVGQLIANSSVFLSPHRSEGFGLAIAEAFLADVPSLATGWSGNMDFMATVPELLIAHKQIPVHDPGNIYRAVGLSWAEPDVEDAAQKLRALATSSKLRRELAARGKACLQAQAELWSRDALASTPIGKLLDQA